MLGRNVVELAWAVVGLVLAAILIASVVHWIRSAPAREVRRRQLAKQDYMSEHRTAVGELHDRYRRACQALAASGRFALISDRPIRSASDEGPGWRAEFRLADDSEDGPAVVAVQYTVGWPPHLAWTVVALTENQLIHSWITAALGSELPWQERRSH